MSGSSRRPGDRVIRRRLQATRVIHLDEPAPVESPPTTLFHARVFIGAFAVIILVGTLLLMLPWVTRSGESTSLDDALFTATSTTTVTGLVTRDTATHWNWAGQVIILILIQVGGFGFMVGATMILSILGRSDTRLRDQILIRHNIPTLSLSDAVDLARSIFKFTLLVEAIGAVLLTIVFLRERSLPDAAWHGLFHSISAFCNAGFDLQGNFQSMAPYKDSISVNLIFLGIVMAGSLSYIVLADVARRRRWDRLSVNSKLVLLLTLVLTVIAMLAFLLAEWNGAMVDDPNWTKPMQALFQAVSGRTAGFSTVDMSSASPFTLFTYLAMMFVGGASGSTAGGVKVGTLAVVIVLILTTVKGEEELQIYRRRLPITLIHRAITVLGLFLFAHFLVTLTLAATERVYGMDPPFVRLLFEAMSATVSNGLSNGITPTLHTTSKLFLCVAMFLGRIGPLTLVYALQSRQTAVRYRYPEETVHIG